jgi:hypothetical protein
MHEQGKLLKIELNLSKSDTNCHSFASVAAAIRDRICIPHQQPMFKRLVVAGSKSLQSWSSSSFFGNVTEGPGNKGNVSPTFHPFPDFDGRPLRPLIDEGGFTNQEDHIMIYHSGWRPISSQQ